MGDQSLTELFDNPDEQRAYEEFCANQERGNQPFDLDAPALVCRWRMSKKRVPLLNRHIRALSHRIVMGEPLTHNMLSWAKQHVEWSLTEGSYAEHSGVLMLVIDVNGNAAMTVGAYEPLEDASAVALSARAAAALVEEAETGVAPEVLCCIRDGRLLAAAGEHACGSLSLVEQLAATRGIPVERVCAVDALEPSSSGSVFLVSDEHGVVPACEMDGDESDDARAVRFLRDGVAKLFS